MDATGPGHHMANGFWHRSASFRSVARAVCECNAEFRVAGMGNQVAEEGRADYLDLDVGIRVGFTGGLFRIFLRSTRE